VAAGFRDDRKAPFGGIIVVNQTLEGDLAKAIAEIFMEVIIARASVRRPWRSSARRRTCA